MDSTATAGGGWGRGKGATGGGPLRATKRRLNSRPGRQRLWGDALELVTGHPGRQNRPTEQRQSTVFGCEPFGAPERLSNRGYLAEHSKSAALTCTFHQAAPSSNHQQPMATTRCRTDQTQACPPHRPPTTNHSAGCGCPATQVEISVGCPTTQSPAMQSLCKSKRWSDREAPSCSAPSFREWRTWVGAKQRRGLNIALRSPPGAKHWPITCRRLHLGVPAQGSNLALNAPSWKRGGYVLQGHYPKPAAPNVLSKFSRTLSQWMLWSNRCCHSGICKLVVKQMCVGAAIISVPIYGLRCLYKASEVVVLGRLATNICRSNYRYLPISGWANTGKLRGERLSRCKSV